MQEARTETEVVGNREGPADVRLLEMLRQHPHDETWNTGNSKVWPHSVNNVQKQLYFRYTKSVTKFKSYMLDLKRSSVNAVNEISTSLW